MNTAATILLLLIVISLLLALAQGGWSGPDGVTGWLRAKFLGRPSTK